MWISLKPPMRIRGEHGQYVHITHFQMCLDIAWETHNISSTLLSLFIDMFGNYYSIDLCDHCVQGNSKLSAIEWLGLVHRITLKNVKLQVVDDIGH